MRKNSLLVFVISLCLFSLVGCKSSPESVKGGSVTINRKAYLPSPEKDSPPRLISDHTIIANQPENPKSDSTVSFNEKTGSLKVGLSGVSLPELPSVSSNYLGWLVGLGGLVFVGGAVLAYFTGSLKAGLIVGGSGLGLMVVAAAIEASMDWLPWLLGFVVIGGGIYAFITWKKMTLDGKALDQSVDAIEKIKETAPDIWNKIKDTLSKTMDTDVKKKVREVANKIKK